MRSLWWNANPATGWFVRAPSRRGLQRLFLWCLVVAAAQVLLSSPQFGGRPLTATGKLASGRVVITGGGGNIGKHLTQRLLASGTAVTVIDHIFYPDEIGLKESASNPLLNVHIGDIRNATLLSSIFTSHVVGVVHLADVSRVRRCDENPADCKDINERGTQLVLESLEYLNRNDQGKRWFVLASSLEVYGDATTPLCEDTPTKPSSVYGVSKLAAERVVETRVRNIESSSAVGAIRAITLRLSNVYGGSFDHEDRLIPTITTGALWNQVIQVSGGQQILDMLHIDDCINAFLLAIQSLTGDTSLKTHILGAPEIYDVFNIASGHMVSVSTLVNNVISLTRSKSPIRAIPADAHFSSTPLPDVHKALRQLGFRASVDIEKGLGMTLRMYMQRFEQYFSRRIGHTCGTPPPDVLEKQLEKLDGCSAHIHVNDQGQLKSLAVSPDTPHFRSDDGVFGMELYIKLSSGPNARTRTIRISGHKNGFYLGSRNPSNAPESIVGITEDELKSNKKLYVDWEIEANSATSAVRFILSGTEFQLAGPASSALRSLRLISKHSESPPPFRFSPMCCPTPGPYPFTTDDPIDYTVEYQRHHTERPFLGSPKKASCDRLQAALKRVKGKLAAPMPSLSQNFQRHMSPHAGNWSMANLPACSNICEDVTVCIDTGDCQCVVESCIHRQRSPFSASTHGSGLSFPRRVMENEPLAEALTSWKEVLRPAVQRFIDAELPLPRIHVAPLSPTNQAYVQDLGPQFYDRVYGHCFSADVEMEKSVARMGVQLQDAEMTFIPMYWKRFPELQGYFEQYDYVKESLPGFDPGRVVIPFTHDWGQCVVWEPNVWDLRKTHGLKHFPMIRNTTAWSVMGDLNSVCYRPHQDVIIPPRACLTSYHFQSFSDLAALQPSRSRSVMATFTGSAWGTGLYNRARVQCPRKGWTPESPERRLHPDGPPLDVIWGSFGRHPHYNALLNDTVFCPQPAGSTGWTTRLIDSMYAGCIPVFIGHTTHYVFHDMLDWSKISLRIEPHEIADMEDLLLSRYSLHHIEQLQRNILAIRSALVYPLDEWEPGPSQRLMLDERGPLYFALQSTRMKLMTLWPT